jgi:hypothetical protein
MLHVCSRSVEQRGCVLDDRESRLQWVSPVTAHAYGALPILSSSGASLLFRAVLGVCSHLECAGRAVAR